MEKQGCGRLCAPAFSAVLQVPVGAVWASIGTSASTPIVASGSALRIAQGGAVDPDGVALMAQPTEEGFDEGFVAEKGLPFRVVEIRRNNRGLAPVAFLHQLEEDVGLFGFEIEVPELVNLQHVDPDQRVEQAARGSIGERRVHLVEEILRPDEAGAIAVLKRLEQEPRREPGLPHAG